MEMNLEQFAARVLEAAQQAGIAPAELCSGSTESFTARVRDGALEDYQVSDRLSVTLRGRVGERIGTASTQAMDEESVALLIQGVRESAALIENDEQDDILPPDERYETVCNYSAELDALPAQEKIALAMDIDRLMHEGDARLKADASVVSTAKSTVSMRNTLGLNLSHTSNMIYAYTSALAKEGESAATGFKLLWGYGLKDVDARTIAEGCQKDALANLGAGRTRSGSTPAVIKASAMADLLSTFSGVFSADNAQKGMSLLSGREGSAIASACVTITDDPLLPWGMNSCPFDMEGAAARTKHIVEGGVLKTLLHNRQTAKRAGCATTGNAAGGGRVAPSNLFIAPGARSAQELLENMSDGLYVTEVSGLHAGANPISGDFSLLARGFEVRGGKIARAVEQFTVAGNFYRLLEDVLSVGNDLTFEGSPIGSPSVAVRALSVAGEDGEKT